MTIMNLINHHQLHKNHNHPLNGSGGGCSDYNDKMQRTQDYVEALEEERKKILVFQRELPLCLELVTQAIETCKQQLCGTISEYNFHADNCSEQTSTEGPVLEEFIPLKRTLSSDDDEEDEEQSHKAKKSNTSNGNEKASSNKKSDWLRSVQLWNQTPDPPKNEDSPKKASVVEVKRNGSGGAFHPFKKEKSVGPNNATTKSSEEAQKVCDRAAVPAAEASSTAETGGAGAGGSGNAGNNNNNKKEEKEGQSSSGRKSRRCWSPELHKRFLLALQQLGGAHVATPKQIRELMKVDGLTNDEVKSHLQVRYCNLIFLFFFLSLRISSSLFRGIIINGVAI
ncbi:OLC1v1032376C1 [Oldenlandia corymbosa var. corymbosa]|uniref:OLC1v1032376C1 n=1 Tax=Oldenlandia corymbosa var. corymbosa TaxID=529605 RepID=A0AAV1CLM2_OLDCO|nr:OLC1v1032376C1 [Oldenlandia corymbosa var. corymbosa]